jgi:hypothetical protein
MAMMHGAAFLSATDAVIEHSPAATSHQLEQQGEDQCPKCAVHRVIIWHVTALMVGSCAHVQAQAISTAMYRMAISIALIETNNHQDEKSCLSFTSMSFSHSIVFINQPKEARCL